ncbi:MAG: hypothetical protein ACR2NO_06115 [Chloroflexota bacterium]
MRRAALDTRRIVLLTAIALVAALTIVATYAPRQTGETQDATGLATLRVYRAATGTFPLPDRSRAPFDFTQAEATAREARSPLAFTLWVDQTEFETRAWRDLVQVGRFPLARPPVLDLAREVGVLVWPVQGIAPDSVMRANGLVAGRLVPQHVHLELHISPDSGGSPPATPSTTGAVVPYALFTIPRNQWPLPAPPPTIPPLTVTLAR